MNPRDEYVYTNIRIGQHSPVKTTIDKDLNTLYGQLTKNFLKDINRKHIVITKPGKILSLENNAATLSMLDVTALNKFGLDIHLLDIPSFYHLDHYGFRLYTNFENEYIDNIFSYEFDSIESFANKNKLTNVNVYCNAYNIHTFSKKYSNLNLYCTPTGWQYPTYWTFNFVEPDSKKEIVKKIWCGNWKYTEHRHLISAFLSNYKEDVHMSWFYNVNIDILKSRLWFNLENLDNKNKILKGANFLEQNSPIIMDQKISLPLTIDNLNTPNIDHSMVPSNYYKESFCAVVTETRFAQPFAALTEKTIQAIIHAMPFILVGPPFSLKYIKDMGWKTFDKWWDESYDTETNHQRRLDKILDLLAHISSLSYSTLTDMYNDMIPILIHNQKHTLTLQKYFQKNNINDNLYFKNLRCL